MNKVVLYCRPGFEKECAAEITDKAARLEVFGFARVKEDSGYVIFEGYQQDDGEKLVRDLPFSSLIFARQMFVVGELLRDLPPEDRITPIVGMLQGVVEKGGELRVEVADTNESKELMKFCRKFTVPLRAALREAGVLTNYETPKRPVVHVFFIAPGCCYTGYSYSNNNSPFYMGIPRLKFPSDAPSRSTLKLEEAFHVFIPADEWDERLANGMYAVDLGACPGGWTYQLVKPDGPEPDGYRPGDLAARRRFPLSSEPQQHLVDGLRYGGETGEGGGADGAVAGQRLVPGDHLQPQAADEKAL